MTTKPTIIPSILDQLVDHEPDKQQESIKAHRQLLSEFYCSIRRDLENLLNTRKYCLVYDKGLFQLAQSLINYGIADFMGKGLVTSCDQAEFCEKLEKTIQQFEPRFKKLEIKLLKNASQQDRILRLRIEALLRAESAPELIIFNSVLQPETNSFAVLESGIYESRNT